MWNCQVEDYIIEYAIPSPSHQLQYYLVIEIIVTWFGYHLQLLACYYIHYFQKNKIMSDRWGCSKYRVPSFVSMSIQNNNNIIWLHTTLHYQWQWNDERKVFILGILSTICENLTFYV
jgi:hypothetical protein